MTIFSGNRKKRQIEFHNYYQIMGDHQEDARELTVVAPISHVFIFIRNP